MKLFYSVLFTLVVLPLSAQNFFQIHSPSKAELDSKVISTKNSSYYNVDLQGIEMVVKFAPYIENTTIGSSTFFLSVPDENGTMQTYRILRNQTMHPDHNNLFPNIIAFDGVNTTNPSEKAKFDITPQGFHGMIFRKNKSTLFIDPISPVNKNIVQVYLKKDFETTKTANCEQESVEEKIEKLISSDLPEYGNCQLRTYRLALAATAEYTAFHGGATNAAAAQVTTMNRVNGIYQRDLAITFVIVAGNSALIYTNSATDPYTNGNAGSMITQNVSNINAVIGSSNYDIGHVFGTNSGGLAGLGVVCSSNKARGVTGSNAPVGDPFDVDYVAHEIGHQFGANHTQNNSCQRNGATAVEPGSASTIMGYAGICPPNVQNNSDDHFHGISLGEMSNFILGNNHTCPVITPLTNAEPVIVSTNGNVSVPISTPFALTCIATDADNDPLTYNWEQTNNQVSTQAPVATSTTGPNFRSFPSNTSPTRYFPRLSALASNGPFTWEVLPSVSRTMAFRCSVRDNAIGGGCSDFVNTTVTTVASAGPFVVNIPSSTGITWAGQSNQTVTWTVANTTAAPINAAFVDIFLSTDGGLTFPTLLVSGTPNDGSESIIVPNSASTTARVMVISSQGTFFDISNNNFTITVPTFGFTISSNPGFVTTCSSTPAIYAVTSNSIGGFSNPITLSVSNLPSGANAVFSPNPINPGQPSTLTVTNVPAGSYLLNLVGTGSVGSQTTAVQLIVESSSIPALIATQPLNGATNASIPATLTWNAALGNNTTYDVDISLNSNFSTIAFQASGLTTTSFQSGILAPNTVYFWRVRAVNNCGTSNYTVSSFTTGACFNLSASDIPIVISSGASSTINSTISVPISGFVTSISIPNISGTHSYISDLTFSLIGANGAEIELFGGICTNNDNFNLGMNDAAPLAVIPCPPTTGLSYKPNELLSSFIASSIQGNWTLKVVDGFNNDGGTLDSWSLDICTSVSPCTPSSTPTISGPSIICAGETATLSIASGNLNDATNWEWYGNSCASASIGTGTTINVAPTANTSYFVRGVGGCVTNAVCGSQQINVNNLNATLVVNGSQLSSSNANGSYQWIDCGNNNAIIPGATSQVFNPLAIIGSYAVIVAFNGCIDTSNCFTLNQTNIDEIDDLMWSVSPNPTTDAITIQWDESVAVNGCVLIDSKGRRMSTQSVSNTEKSVVLSMRNFARGIYFLNVKHEHGVKTIKVLKE